jgi:glycosyltransferase involved in cell wall biosynthesis
MNISIVIPVYNEADRIGACLRAIANQISMPHEVIVVDNNSTDKTVQIAKSFPFVTVVSEKHQGVVYARSRGFDLATGDIIGRLDADSLIPPDWTEVVDKIFTDDSQLTAVTGKVKYYGLAMSYLLDGFDLWARRRMARLLGREVALQGSNMALRRKDWLEVKKSVCHEAKLHEDFDLAIHLSRASKKVVFDENLTASIDCRRLDCTWFDFCYYAWLSPKTYFKHDLKSGRHMLPIVIIVILFYFPFKIMQKGWNEDSQHFSWKRVLVSQPKVRVNPATFVD